MRTFIAIELSGELRKPLVALLRTLPRTREVKWCTEQQLHVTLKFLGEVTDAQINRVCEAAAAACVGLSPFRLRIRGLGCFPSPRNPRVLWCGVDDPSAGCRRWVEQADPLFDELGFRPEGRAFTPHVTLGRSRSAAGSAVMREVVEGVDAPQTPEMLVDHIVVFESRLLPGGAQYYPLATIPFPTRQE